MTIKNRILRLKEGTVSKIDQKMKHKQLVDTIDNKRSIIGRHLLNVQIQTISTCNGKCYFCPYLESWHKQNPGTMDDSLYRSIIDQLSEYEIGKFCPYLENEPFADKKILDRIEYGLSQLNISRLEIATNAALLDSDKIKQTAKLLHKVNHEIWISFHGINETSYHAIMGLDFEKAKNNVLELIAASQKYDLNIVIRGSGQPRQKQESLPEWFTEKAFTAFWKSEFVKHNFKRKPNLNYFPYHDRAGQIKRNEINFTGNARKSLSNFYCNRFDQWLHFLYSGEMILCCMDYHKDTVYGNIRQDDLKTIMQSDRYRQLIKKGCGLSPSDLNFICRKCVSPGG